MNLSHTNQVMLMMKENWEQSYLSGDNNILYPQTEVIRFLNQFIAKKTHRGCKPVLDNCDSNLTGLDFACGIGTHCLTLYDFGIEGHGVDISQVAVDIAKTRMKDNGLNAGFIQRIDDFKSLNQFSDNYFDFTIAESCLDSMPFKVAKEYIPELKRITRKYIYASFIGFSDRSNADEFIIETPHEKGTVQSVYDRSKILDLFECTLDSFRMIEKKTIINEVSGKNKTVRYYCVIEL